MDMVYKNLLSEVADLHDVPMGAYNIRQDGESVERNTTANIDIVTKEDKSGIDIIVKPATKNESIHIPVVIARTGHKELVYNDFHIGDDADVVIIAGCGIHNCGDQETAHDGIHRFFLGKNSRVKYVEKHIGSGDGDGKTVMNPTTEIEMGEGSYMEMDSLQIEGVDRTKRVTRAKIGNDAILIVNEKIMTNGDQIAETQFDVELNGKNSSTHVVSRSVAKDHSQQIFLSKIDGNNKCNGHTECDAIIMGDARVTAIPEVTSNHIDASLIHEAAIGKIAGEQLTKLMTLGLDEEEAEAQIITGFMK